MTLQDLDRMVEAAGYTPSARGWEDSDRAFAFSVEHNGPATYGHPTFTLELDKSTGVVYHKGRPYHG